MRVRRYIEVTGIVQGVGFRPFVYRIAVKENLDGWVKNTSRGVYIDIEGEVEKINNFIINLKKEAPILSRIENIYIEERDVCGLKGFSIIESENEDVNMTLLSPDIATCKECISEIVDKYDTRYKYAFTNCTNCGPRFSIIKNLPYDRKNTTMKIFDLCEYCSKEYKNPLNRRFHAEPTCCSKCGPELTLIDNVGNEIKCGDILKEVQKLLLDGKILAVKGLGGFNIICNGENEEAIEAIRIRKHRKTKPLALMMKNKESVNEFCYINSKEYEILESEKKPILLLKKREEKLPRNIAYENITLGVMLPYTPLHYLLFNDSLKVLVFTSGNLSGMPMIYKNEDALEELKDVVDYFVIHNREINFPVDDSVVEVIMGEERVIRPGRGYSPTTRKIEDGAEVLALGSELKNTFTITKSKYAFTSPYLGNMDNIKAYENFERNIAHFKHIYDIDIKKIIYDAHPNHWSKFYIENLNIEKIETYHHHSHIVSCMIDNNEYGEVIGLAFDGVGYGQDGYMWGSEFLICNYKRFKRMGHLKYFKLPGGDIATKEPWRIALSLTKDIIINHHHDKLPKQFKKINIKTIRFILDLMEREFNSPLCSSMGRLFDGVASLLGFIGEVTYEGEAAIFLENLAHKSNSEKAYDFKLSFEEKTYIIDVVSLIREILNDINKKVSIETIAKKFHNTIINFSKEICLLLRGEYHINKVALSGGVFQNKILLEGITKALEKVNFKVLTHKSIPCNDSGISIGQLYIGKAKTENIK